MCGISFCLHHQSKSIDIDYAPLNARGPDFQNRIDSYQLASDLYVDLAVSVLALRGVKQYQQPFLDDQGNILLYNGEIYQAPFPIDVNDNDGQLLSTYLKQCVTDVEICQCLSQLEGCFAFIYYQKQHNCLYYGRDRLGRRSLLASVSNTLPMIVSSVRLGDFSCAEINANTLYKLTVQSDENSFDIQMIPYMEKSIDVMPFESSDRSLNELESSEMYENLSQTFLQQLQSAVQRRLNNLPSLCRNCKRLSHEILRPSVGCDHAKLAILFSGGIDSSVLAVLTDRILPVHEPIDLLNVGFFSNVSTPPADRQTGLEALKELNPSRHWNFVKIDIPLDELQHYREHSIKDVLYPCSTVLDDSIGSALWFAARGQGILHQTDEIYNSPAEVLLSGLGADEQLAGYSRHRTTFQSGGWEALTTELQMEMNRISKRNLGRDDRVISSLGKEVRFPFLDEQFVDYLHSIPVWYKADLRLARGVGEKYLLRFVARQYLNLHRSSTYPKRAIQFGSRIAKLESKKEKASDQCSRLLNNRSQRPDDDED